MNKVANIKDLGISINEQYCKLKFSSLSENQKDVLLYTDTSMSLFMVERAKTKKGYFYDFAGSVDNDKSQFQWKPKSFKLRKNWLIKEIAKC